MLILVRHGQTAANRSRVLLGRSDVPLTDLGRAQAASTCAAVRATCNVVAAPETMSSPNTKGFDVCTFDLDAANAELDRAGWVKGADGVRAKNGTKLRKEGCVVWQCGGC